ncbi:hypothetical protein G7Y89_g6710 [Cudoniella acicularis]|uniref:Alpha/beta hydrolase fold-3 domain-containing protein n=1 Tax=Cudoniella acicularis TaxID=354080 RepID=A0A8H4RKR7_9HELO|nr:hypothetical protein G7Y89_g6710 [Cudoniella acicularis]
MMSRDEQSALAEQNPELTEILKTNPPPPPLGTAPDIFALRAHLLEQKKKLTAATASASTSGPPTYTENDEQIPTRDGSTITVRIHRPKSASECPSLVIYHGGGFVLGGLDNEVALCRKWTEMGGVAVNVEYRLAPEHPFPKAVEDAYDALEWTAANVKELDVNPEKGFLVGGISAGANLAAVVSYLWRDNKMSPSLTGQYLSIPAVCTPEAMPSKYQDFCFSMEQNKDALILNEKSVYFFDSLYKVDPKSPLRSPLIFPSHKDLPPAYFQICGADPLRDEGLLYEKVLREEYGIKTRLDLFPGLPHGFWSSYPQAEFSKKFQVDTAEGLKWLLEQAR